jgi:hypothetical protein
MIYAKFYLIDTWRDMASLALNLTSGKYTKILPGKVAHLQFCITSQWTHDKIKGLYDIYTNRPVAAPAPSDSSTGSLFGTKPSDSSIQEASLMIMGNWHHVCAYSIMSSINQSKGGREVCHWYST